MNPLLKIPLELYKEQKQVLNALKNNESTLIIAETGSGKTIITVAKILQLIENYPAIKILIVCPTNILCEQHYNKFQSYLNYPIFHLKSTNRYQLRHLQNPGIYLTTGHFGAILAEKFALSEDFFNLIVYDEAHKALSENAPFALIAKKFKCYMLGFSATPGGKIEINKLKQKLNLVYTVYGRSPFSYSKTVDKKEVLNDSKIYKLHKFFELWIHKKYHLIFEKLKFKHGDEFLRLFILHRLKINQMVKQKILPVQTYNLFYLLYANYLFFYESPETMRNYIETKRKTLLKNPVIALLLKNKNLIPCKYHQIKLAIENFKSQTSLVFFENYQTLLNFKNYLISCGYDPHQIVSLAGKSKMTAKIRNQLLESVKDQQIKVILATSVIEEGVDLKGVDLVVFFKPISNKIRIIQRKGRTGRHADGRIIIFAYKNTKEVQILKKIPE